MEDKSMKQNLIISGVPRAGKSTIANAISRKYGYQQICMDSIIAGFEQNFPELGIDSKADIDHIERLKYLSKKIAPFINSMMESGEYDEFDKGMVLDVFQLLPEDFIGSIDKSYCDIFFFVTSDVSAEERFEILKKYDKEKDYTFYDPDNELRELCINLVKESKFIKEECLKYGLPCIETSKNRDIVIKNFIENLE
jgi:hypothetical protein